MLPWTPLVWEKDTVSRLPCVFLSKSFLKWAQNYFWQIIPHTRSREHLGMAAGTSSDIAFQHDHKADQSSDKDSCRLSLSAKGLQKRQRVRQNGPKCLMPPQLTTLVSDSLVATSLQYSIHTPGRHMLRELALVFPHLSKDEKERLLVVPTFQKSLHDLVAATSETDAERNHLLDNVCGLSWSNGFHSPHPPKTWCWCSRHNQFISFMPGLEKFVTI